MRSRFNQSVALRFFEGAIFTKFFPEGKLCAHFFSTAQKAVRWLERFYNNTSVRGKQGGEHKFSCF